jgi:hypothetical protein
MRIVKGIAALVVVIALVLLPVWLVSKMPAQLAGLVGAAVGFAATKFYESWKETKTRLYDKKRDVYLKLLQPWRGLLIELAIDPNHDVAAYLSPEMRREMIATAFDSILYASDDVVRAYGRFRTVGEAPPIAIMRRLALLLKAMRKDLGNAYTNISDEEMLQMFVNLSDEQRSALRGA